MFMVSYASVLRWVKKLSCVLGAADLRLTTRSFRRCGASELARQNVPLSVIPSGDVEVLRQQGFLRAFVVDQKFRGTLTRP